MRISDWSSDVCSSDLQRWSLPRRSADHGFPANGCGGQFRNCRWRAPCRRAADEAPPHANRPDLIRLSHKSSPPHSFPFLFRLPLEPAAIIPCPVVKILIPQFEAEQPPVLRSADPTYALHSLIPTSYSY